MFFHHCKKLVLGASLAFTALVMPLILPMAHAAAPMVKTPAPGYFRIMLGDYEVTALSDGTVELPVDKLLTAPEIETQQALQKVFLNTPLETSVNAYLINTGKKLVLIDVGAGSLFGPTLGKLAVNLQAAGYQPEQVDDIFITHLHGDHVGGLMNGKAQSFPNAVIHVDQHDSNYWLNKENLEAAPEDKKGFFLGAMNSLNPYIHAKKFIAFNGTSEPIPGIKTMATYGHTAGHSIYQIESQGKKLWLIGDLIHVAAMQLEHPEVTIAFDSDPVAAAKARAKVFAEAAEKGILIGASHFQFPGLGYLKKTGASYEWIPVNYTQMHSN